MSMNLIDSLGWLGKGYSRGSGKRGAKRQRIVSDLVDRGVKYAENELKHMSRQRRKLWMRPQLYGYGKKIIYPGRGTAMSKHDISGYHLKNEQGGTEDDPDCVYLLAGCTPPRRVAEGMFNAIVKTCAKRIGFNIPDWSNVPNGQPSDYFYLKLYYKDTPAGENKLWQTNIAGNVAWSLIGAQLMDVIMLSMNTGVWEYVELVSIGFEFHRGGIICDEVKVRAGEVKLRVDCLQKLSIQNRTLAKTGTADESNILDVANNPLVGKVYRGYQTAVSVRSQYGTTLGSNPFILVDKQAGIRTIGANDSGISAQLNVKKPQPYKSYVGLSSDQGIRILPGEIKRFACYYHKTISLSGLFLKLKDWFQSGVSSSASFGDINLKFPTVMVALERMLNSRDSEPLVTVGYETNNDIGITAYFVKKMYTNPRTIIG